MAQSPLGTETPKWCEVVMALSNGMAANNSAPRLSCSTQPWRPRRSKACNRLRPQAIKNACTSQSERSVKLTGSRRLAQKNAAMAIINPDMLAIFSTSTKRSSKGITEALACLS